ASSPTRRASVLSRPWRDEGRARAGAEVFFMVPMTKATGWTRGPTRWPNGRRPCKRRARRARGENAAL
ncbi:unnamed protein product, partial [Durusdinium trenchii]